MGIILSWLIFIFCGLAIILAGMRMARCGDIIGEKTGLGRAWIGLLLLAMATSMPEVVTTVTGGAINAPRIALGNIFGSNMFNIFILAALNVVGGGVLFLRASEGHYISGLIAILLSAVAILGIIIKMSYNVLGIGSFSIIILFVYLFGMWFLYGFHRGSEIELEYEGFSLKKAAVEFAIASAIVITAGIFLTISGKEIAQGTRLGETFVGVLFIAAATSLPELATSLGALKIGAYDMIVGNIFGSNMFNIFVIFFADVSFRRGRLLGEGGGDQVMVASLGILLTSLAILGMGQRSGKFSTLIKQTLTWLILAAYLIGIYILYLRGVEF